MATVQMIHIRATVMLVGQAMLAIKVSLDRPGIMFKGLLSLINIIYRSDCFYYNDMYK